MAFSGSDPIGAVNLDQIRNRDRRQVFAVGCGVGLDSTGMLILLRDYGIRPDVITFADVGDYQHDKPGEKPETYAYIPVLRAWLRASSFPDLVVVRYITKRVSYTTLAENCLANETLPSLAFGPKGCSAKWKINPQEKLMRGLPQVQMAKAAGMKIIKAIGYDAGPKDIRRRGKAEDAEYLYTYPLREVGWDREEIRRRVVAEGLPGWNADNEVNHERLEWVPTGGVPVKSACYFCPSSKPWELDRLHRTQPDLMNTAVEMEETARHGKHGLTKIRGLGRSWSWTAHARSRQFVLPVLGTNTAAACSAMVTCEACDSCVAAA